MKEMCTRKPCRGVMEESENVSDVSKNASDICVTADLVQPVLEHVSNVVIRRGISESEIA